MPRVKRGVTAHRRHKRVFKQTKGYTGLRRHSIKKAREALLKAWQYAYRDRRTRKRDFRRLWIQRINAGARQHGLSYSQLIAGLKREGVELDRKILAQLAYEQPQAFGKLCEQAKLGLKKPSTDSNAAAPKPTKAPATPAKKAS